MGLSFPSVKWDLLSLPLFTRVQKSLRETSRGVVAIYGLDKSFPSLPTPVLVSQPAQGGAVRGALAGREGQSWAGGSHALPATCRQACVVWPPREQGRKCFRSWGVRGGGCLV